MKIFNPLDFIKDPEPVIESTSSDEQMESTSSLVNDQVGICPKCGSPMSTSIIANNDTVFFCPKDRVALPMPNVTVQ